MPWYTVLHQSKCQKILEYLIKVAQPHRVILFGSAVGGRSRANDLDFLVIVANGQNTRALAHKLYSSKPRVGIGVDFIVVDEQELRQAQDDVWSVVHEAVQKGKEIYVSETA